MGGSEPSKTYSDERALKAATAVLRFDLLFVVRPRSTVRNNGLFTGDAALYTSDVGEDEGCAAPFEDEVGCAALLGRDEGCPAPSEAEGQRAAGCAAPLDGVGLQDQSADRLPTACAAQCA